VGIIVSLIESLSHKILDGRELQLASHLTKLLEDPVWDAASLIEDILPIYCEKKGESYYTLDPDPIYRPLYYLHIYADSRNFSNNTRIFLINTGAHLEGCVSWLTETRPKYRSSSLPLGKTVEYLSKNGILQASLAKNLLEFNKTINVPAKHFKVMFVPHSRLDKRTFRVLEAALGFMMMRKLSIELFALLGTSGVTLPQGWKDFDEKWLFWEKRRQD
jgi:hypothetical protein